MMRAITGHVPHRCQRRVATASVAGGTMFRLPCWVDKPTT